MQNMQNPPSTETYKYWIYAVNTDKNYPEHTEQGGKWLIFVDEKLVDSVWEKIRTIVEEGSLGMYAKVSTAKTVRGIDKSRRVICVYTYDHRDTVDLMRIRNQLKEHGFKNKLKYKIDEATRKGIEEYLLEE